MDKIMNAYHTNSGDNDWMNYFCDDSVVLARQS